MSGEMAKLLQFAFLLAFSWKIHGLNLDEENNSLTGLFTESTEWSDEVLDNAPRFNFCHGSGLQPYFRSCRKYVFCLNQIGYIFDCPPGLHFNAKSQKCVLPCAAFCDQDFACICNWRKCLPNDYQCPTPNGNFTVFNNCSVYLQCKDYMPAIQECSEGKAFDTVKKICVPSLTAVCDNSDYDKLNSQAFACPERNGNFSVPMSCIKYMECKNSKPTLQLCPNGKSFDAKTKTCVPWYEAICDQSSGKDLHFPIELKCPQSDGNFSVPMDCTKYISCKNSKSTPKECPRGKYFDSKKKICVPWYEAFCYPGLLVGTDSIRNHVMCSQEGVFHYRQNCKKYIMCADKKLYMMDCPEDKSFDYIKKVCVPDSEVRCYN